MLVAVLAAIGLVALSSASIAAQDATATPTVAVTPAADAPRLELEFEELNDSGVSGTATLYESGDQTIVELSLEDTGENHPAHIHAGSCGDLQPEPEYPLQNVGGEGQSTSVVDASVADLIAGDFAIDLHLSPNELGTLIVCANIEGEPQVPSAAGTPGATPEATPTDATQPPAPTATQPPAPTATQPPAPTATQPPAPTATQPPAPTATQPPAPTAAQPPAPTATQPPAPTATQPPAPTATQPPAPTPTQAATEAPQPTMALATQAVEAAIAAATQASNAVIAQATDGGEAPDVAEPAVTEPQGDAEPDEAEDVADALDGTGGAINDSESAASAPLPSTSDPDVDGTVVLTTLDAGTTRISVGLNGDEMTGDAIVHLHDGTCNAPGDFTLDLDPIDADGISETDVDLTLDELLADGYFINVHQSETAYDTLLVCGELSDATVGMVMPEDPSQPEASGSSTDQTPAAEATTPIDDETPEAGTTIVTTPKPTVAPTAAPAQGDVTGDGTSGDVADSSRDSGKGSPVDPTTGLPQTTGTGPFLPGDQHAIDRAAWISSALALLSLAAGIRVRRVDLQRSRSITTTTTPSRQPSGWKLPDI